MAPSLGIRGLCAGRGGSSGEGVWSPRGVAWRRPPTLRCPQPGDPKAPAATPQIWRGDKGPRPPGGPGRRHGKTPQGVPRGPVTPVFGRWPIFGRSPFAAPAARSRIRSTAAGNPHRGPLARQCLPPAPPPAAPTVAAGRAARPCAPRSRGESRSPACRSQCPWSLPSVVCPPCAAPAPGVDLPATYPPRPAGPRPSLGVSCAKGRLGVGRAGWRCLPCPWRPCPV